MALMKLRNSLKPCQLPTGDFILDKSNVMGAHSFLAFFPGMYGHTPILSGDTALYHETLGQRLRGNIINTSASSANMQVRAFSGGGNWGAGYNGLVADFYDQTASGGMSYDFGGGADGQIKWPNKQNLSMWCLIKPDGHGDGAGAEDPRIVSRDEGVGSSDHYYMIGSTRAGVARTRVKTASAGTQTIVSAVDLQENALNFIMMTYDGDRVRLKLLREDGTFDPQVAVVSGGDIQDSSGAGVRLRAGSNGGDDDNAYQGQLLGWGCLDYAENDESKIRAFAANICQIVKPRRQRQYFTPVVGGATIVSITGQEISSEQGAVAILNAHGEAITGQEISSEQGTVTAISAVNEALTGQEIPSEQGNIVATGAVNEALTGQEISSQQGNVIAGGGIVEALTGQEISSEQGVVTATGAVNEALTGQEISSEQGELVITGAATISLTGQEISSEQGIIVVDVGGTVVLITGQEISSEQGNIVVTGEATLSLIGQEISSEHGTLVVSVAGTNVLLIGQEFTSQQGVIVVTGRATISLTGQEISSEQGVVTVDTGVDSTPIITFTAVKPQRSYIAVKPTRSYDAAKLVNIL